MPQVKGITTAQAFEVYREFIEVNGYAPSTREFADALGIGTSSAHRHLLNLEASKLIVRAEGKSRGTALRTPLVAPHSRSSALAALITEAALDLDELAAQATTVSAQDMAAALAARAAGLRAGLGRARVEA